MGIKCGIVGLPNVGKSTLFNALTKAGIAAANFPFCTIEPNVGVVPVPDPRLNALSEIVKPQKCIPTAVEFVDIAGLVAGAASGEGPRRAIRGVDDEPFSKGRANIDTEDGSHQAIVRAWNPCGRANVTVATRFVGRGGDPLPFLRR